MHLVSWTVAMAAFWLLLSGFFQPLLLVFGAFSVALVIYTIERMDRVGQELKSLMVGPKLVRYLAWLMGQIALSSIQVTRLVWGPRSQLQPKVGYIKMSPPYERGRVLYANSITLTPGTLSIDVIDDVITVHALHAHSLDDLHKGDMEKRISQLKGSSKQ